MFSSLSNFDNVSEYSLAKTQTGLNYDYHLFNIDTLSNSSSINKYVYPSYFYYVGLWDIQQSEEADPSMYDFFGPEGSYGFWKSLDTMKDKNEGVYIRFPIIEDGQPIPQVNDGQKLPYDNMSEWQGIFEPGSLLGTHRQPTPYPEHVMFFAPGHLSTMEQIIMH